MECHLLAWHSLFICCWFTSTTSMHALILVFLFQVTDSRGHILYSKEDATKGRFAFTTEEYDMFEVCFTAKAMQGGILIMMLIFLMGIKEL